MTVRAFVPAALFCAGVYFLYTVHHILLPFVLGAVLAYLLNPAVSFFEIRGLRRRPMAVLVFLVFVLLLSGLCLGGITLASEEASKAAKNMPQYVQRGQVYFERLKGPESQPTLFGRMVKNGTLDHGMERARLWPGTVLEKMPHLAAHLFPLIELAFLVPFIAFFLMLEGPALVQGFLQFLPSRYVEMGLNILVEINHSFGNYMRGLFLEALCVAMTALIGFWVIGLDYALQLAVLVGLTSIIPLFGPIMVGILGCAVALFQWGTLAGFLKALLVCLGVRLLDDWIYHPVVLKKAVHLHPVIIVFALMAGAHLWGFWGMLFAVPLACMVKILTSVVWQWYRAQYSSREDAVSHHLVRVPLI